MTDLERYLASITNIQTLSKKEQDNLARIIKESDDPKEVDAAKEKLIEGNLFLVVNCAMSYQKRMSFDNVTLMDLVSAGNLGLLQAVDHYNPDDSRGANFCTYAYTTIKSKMLSDMKKGSTIKIPNNYYVYKNKIKKLEEASDDDISDAFICESLNIGKGVLSRMRESFDMTMCHIDGQTGDSGEEYKIDIEDPNPISPFEGIDSDDRVKILKECVNKLSKKQKAIIEEMYFRPDKTNLEFVAKKLGCTKQNVSALRFVALGRLKKMMRNKKNEVL